MPVKLAAATLLASLSIARALQGQTLDTLTITPNPATD
jgi:hypothetical protein